LPVVINQCHGRHRGGEQSGGQLDHGVEFRLRAGIEQTGLYQCSRPVGHISAITLFVGHTCAVVHIRHSPPLHHLADAGSGSAAWTAVPTSVVSRPDAEK